MRALCLALVLAAVSAVCAEDQNPKAGDPLEGVWSVTSIQDNGQMLPASRVTLLRFVFSKGQLTIRRLDQVVTKTRYTIDTSSRPAAIDLTYGGKPTAGIFRVDGNRLTICLGRSADQRPTQFASDASSPSRVLIVLQRGDSTPEGRPLFLIRPDGTGLTRLGRLPKDMMTGSPDWSPDGRWIAWDAWRLIFNETYVVAHILLIRADGTEVRDLGLGAMPSWSPDSRRLAFCRYSPHQGVWVMDADGTHPVLLDADGWGCDWSPVGNEVVYRVSRPFANLVVQDVETGRKRLLFSRQRYQWVLHNMSWSADGRFIAFRGTRADGTEEVAVVSARGDEHGFRVLLSKPPGRPASAGLSIGASRPAGQAGSKGKKAFPRILSLAHIVAWDGTPETILVSMRTVADRTNQLYFLDANGGWPPRRVPGQPADRKNVDMAWAPGGKQIVFASQVPPKKRQRR